MRALVLLTLTLAGCASTPQEWCDDNPRMCRAVVVGAGVIAAGCVAYAATRMSSANTHAQAPVAPIHPPQNPGSDL